MTNRYPLSMVHPQYRPAQSYKIEKHAGPATGSPVGGVGASPAWFPPVTVNNEIQEAHHRSMGYLEFGETPPMVQLNEYPLLMVHPDCAEATPERTITTVDGNNNQTVHVTQGAPGKLPPRQADNPQQEAEWAAKGYRRPGQYNPQAVQGAIASPYDPSKVYQEYPKIVDGKVVDLRPDPSAPQKYPMWLHDQAINTEAEHRAKWPDDFAPEAPPPPTASELAVAKLREENAALLAKLAAHDATPVAGHKKKTA